MQCMGMTTKKTMTPENALLKEIEDSLSVFVMGFGAASMDALSKEKAYQYMDKASDLFTRVENFNKKS